MNANEKYWLDESLASVNLTSQSIRLRAQKIDGILKSRSAGCMDDEVRRQIEFHIKKILEVHEKETENIELIRKYVRGEGG